MDIREEISQTISKLVELEAVKRHYDDVVEQEGKITQQCQELEVTVEKELDDLEKLEGVSVKKLYHKVMGSVEDKKSKEREEYLEAMLNLKEMRQSLELIQYEKDLLYKKIVDIKVLKERLELLKKKREQEILSMDSEFRNALLTIERERDNAWQYKKELEEVTTVGRELDKVLKFILEQFNHSKYWASVNAHPNRANHEIERSLQLAFKALSQARVYHQRFNKELADVNHRHADINLNIDVNDMFPYFFRNFITDIMYQNKIQSAMHLIQSNRSLVTAIENTMNMKSTEQDGVLEELNKRKDTLLTR